MIVIPDIIIITFLLILAYQDFRYKAVSWILLAGIILPVIFKALYSIDASDLAINFMINLLFITIQLTLLTFYFSVKSKRITYIINYYIGIGDVLMLILLCLVFSPVNFILFTIISMLLILILFGIRTLLGNKEKLIPLAGCLSFFLVCILVAKNFILDIDLYDDSYVIDILNRIYA